MYSVDMIDEDIFLDSNKNKIKDFHTATKHKCHHTGLGFFFFSFFFLKRCISLHRTTVMLHCWWCRTPRFHLSTRQEHIFQKTRYLILEQKTQKTLMPSSERLIIDEGLWSTEGNNSFNPQWVTTALVSKSLLGGPCSCMHGLQLKLREQLSTSCNRNVMEAMGLE